MSACWLGVLSWLLLQISQKNLNTRLKFEQLEHRVTIKQNNANPGTRIVRGLTCLVDVATYLPTLRSVCKGNKVNSFVERGRVRFIIFRVRFAYSAVQSTIHGNRTSYAPTDKESKYSIFDLWPDWNELHPACMHGSS